MWCDGCAFAHTIYKRITVLVKKLLILLVSVPVAVFAQTPGQAEKYFQEGRQLMAEKAFEQACPLFEKSHRLEPALGTLLNWADCLERAGHLAQAYVSFNEAAAWAARNHESKREEVALQRAASLKTKVTFVALHLSQPTSGAEAILFLLGEDKPLQRWSLGDIPQSIPLDIGHYRVKIEAPNRISSSVNFEVTGVTRILNVDVPALLEVAPRVEAVPEPPGSSSVESRPDSFTRPPGWPPVVLAVGGTLVAVGSAGVVYGQVMNARVARQQPDGPDAANPTVTRADFQTAKNVYPAAWAVAGVGAAAIAASVVGFAVTPRSSLQLVWVPGPGSLSVSGRF